ncbi:MAG: hypothetical protein P8179_02575 [Candidatus Thiodiazotropha sp.]|jgi:predicted Zn-dependent protease
MKFSHPLITIGLYQLLLILSGCQLHEIRKTAAPVDQDVLTYSQQLVTKGRYSEAIQILSDASHRDKQGHLYINELKTLKNQKKIFEEELNDQLLISNTSALKKQLPILKKLAQSSPDSEYTRLLQKTQKQLQNMRHALSECGWRHYKRNNTLAKDCLSVALSLNQDKSDQNLMEHLINEQRQSKYAHAEKVQADRKQRWSQRINKSLADAEKFSENGQLKKAKRTLKLLLKEAPEHAKAKKLLSKVNGQLERYIENLLTAGDRLYRDGEIEGAKATWRAALALDPQEERAREKILRAQRVLNNLENLRKSR